MEMTFVKTTSANLNQVPVVDGQFIVASDTSQRFLDFDSVREGIASQNEIDAITDVYGAKNLLPFYAVSTVLEDVTWTVDNAKKIITVNGTATNWSYQEGHNYPVTLKAGQKYILSSGVDSSNQYNVYVHMYDARTIDTLCTTENGDVEYTPQTDTIVYCNVVVRSGATVSNVEMKPIIRDARITDPTYVPYAMTNEQLTKRISSIIGLGTIQEWNGDLNDIGSGMFKVNNPALASNLPNTTNIAWIVFSNVAVDNVAFFGFQIAIGYNSGETYARRLWSDWSSWYRLDT